MTSANQAVQLSHLEQTIYFAAQRQGRNLLTAGDATVWVDVSRKHAVNLLASMARKGVLHRIGRGRYAVIPPDLLYQRQSFTLDPHLLLDELMAANGAPEPYYVAYQSAAALHGAAHQLPYTLTIATPQQRRPIDLGQTEIRFVQLQPDRFFGHHETPYAGVQLTVSDREKTILDCLDRFDLCGGIQEVARTISALLTGHDPDRLLDYLVRFDNQALTQRLGLLLERLATIQSIDDDLLAGIARHVGDHVYPLDPHGPPGGALDPRWRIRENVDVLEDL